MHDGRTFTNHETGYFRHDQLPSDAKHWNILDDERAENLSFLLGLRIKADYANDQVTLEESSQAYQLASEIVRWTSGGPGVKRAGEG